MDSKSILLTEVGVRVPSLVPALADARARCADDLAVALLPRLFALLRNHTGKLEHLARRVDREGARVLGSESAFHALGPIDADRRGLGWCLGVLASAAGIDLLVARRERDGLVLLAERVQDALGDRRVVPPPATLPRLSSTVGEGWELPFVVACVLLHAGAALPPASELRWELVPGRTESQLRLFAPPTSAPVGARLERLCALVPGASLEIAAASWRLTLPTSALG